VFPLELFGRIWNNLRFNWMMKWASVGRGFKGVSRGNRGETKVPAVDSSEHYPVASIGFFFSNKTQISTEMEAL
jgi:hypothetical protein